MRFGFIAHPGFKSPSLRHKLGRMARGSVEVPWHASTTPPRRCRADAHRARGPRRCVAPPSPVRRHHHPRPTTASRTSSGKNFGDIGYGYGYAFAQDNICVMADDYVTVEAAAVAVVRPGRRRTRCAATGSRSPTSTATSSGPQISDSHTVDKLLASRATGPAPLAVAPRRGARLRRRLQPLAARRRRRERRSRTRTATGKPWVHPITEPDAYRRFYQLTCSRVRTSSSTGIAEAHAADADAARRRSAALDAAATRTAARCSPAAGTRRWVTIGSNAVAVGRAGTRDHKHGAAARQPALPVGRHRALLPGAAHDPRQARRRGRLACSACRSS